MSAWLMTLGIMNGFAEEIVDQLVENPSDQNIERIQGLESQIQALEEDLRAKDDFLEHELEKVEQIRVLIDSRRGLAERQAALQVLADTHSTMVLPFLYEVLGNTPELDADIIRALPNVMAMDTEGETWSDLRDILQKALYLSELKPSTMTIAIGGAEIVGALNGEMQIRQDIAEVTVETALSFSEPQITSVLYTYIEDTTVPMTLREQSLQGLQNHHAEWLAAQPPVSLMAASDRLANNIYAVSTGVTGSVLLGSVGVWGQSNTSEGIGYTGGALLGAASGWLITQDEHPTLAQSTLMASSVGWGLAQGQLIADGLRLESEYAALTRTLGVSAGTWYGYWARDRKMSLSDVLEADFAGYLGAQVAVALTDIAADQSVVQSPRYEDYFTTTYDDPNYDALYEAEQDAYDEAYRTSNLEQYALQRQKFLMGAAGSLAGLGAAHWLMPSWEPTPESVLFAAVWSGQMAIGSSQFLPAMNVTYPQGWVRLTSHASMVGALAYDHFRPTSYEQSIFAAYGAGTGYLLGYGLNDLSRGPYLDGARNAALFSTLGALGGTTLGNQMNFKSSDWVSTGVGLGLSLWHLQTLSTISRNNDWLQSRQNEGLVLTGMGVSGLALLGTGVKYDISSADAIFLGSSAAWGAYYGALTPIAFNIDEELSGTESLAITLAASDVFLAAGAVGLLQKKIVAEQTAIPQIFGLGGATLGSLGASLFTDSSQAISGAALLGASAGLLSGVMLRRSDSEALALGYSLQKPRWLPSMNLQVSPYTAESGDMGMYLGVMSQPF